MRYTEHIIEIYVIEELRGLVDNCVTVKKNNKKTRGMSIRKLNQYIKSIELNGYQKVSGQFDRHRVYQKIR